MNNIIALNNSRQSLHIHANAGASSNREIKVSAVDPTVCIHPLAAVMGNVCLGEPVTVAPAPSVRVDEIQSTGIGNDVNIQDCVIIHALESDVNGELVKKAVAGVDGDYYGEHTSERVSSAHQCQLQDPASIGRDTFVGMQSLVFRTIIGNNCAIESKLLVMGVNLPGDRYVPVGE